MSISDDIYHYLDNMKEIIIEEKYNILIKSYPKSKVNFIMYNMFEYEHNTDEIKINRNDEQYKIDVKNRYNNSCIISGVSATYQICHIKPFSKCNEYEKYDINNGILLRDDIHKLFDTHDIMINPDTFNISVSDKIMNNINDKCYHIFNGMKANININSKKYLNMKYL